MITDLYSARLFTIIHFSQLCVTVAKGEVTGAFGHWQSAFYSGIVVHCQMLRGYFTILHKTDNTRHSDDVCQLVPWRDRAPIIE